MEKRIVVKGEKENKNMKILKLNPFKTFQLKWWQVGIFKMCLISLGLIIGSIWPAFFRNWIVIVGIICIVTMSYLTYVWWKQ